MSVRKNRGVSIYRLALLTGLDKAYLLRVERGEVSPGLCNLLTICDALGMEIVLREKVE